MKRLIFPVTAAALAGVAAGYWLGKGSTEEGGPGSGGGKAAASRVAGAVGNAAGATAARVPGAENSMAGLSEAEIGAAVSRALREPDRFKRWKQFSAILADLDVNNVGAVSAALEARWASGADTSKEGELLQICEGRVLGAKSLERFPAEPNGTVPWSTLNKMQGWSSVNPREAKKWIEALEPGRAREAMEQRWLTGLAEATPAVIQEVFPELSASQQRPLIKGLVNGLQDEGGFPAVRAWFDKMAKEGASHITGAAVNEIVWRMSRSEQPAATVAEFLTPYAKESFVNAGSFRAFSTEVGQRNPGECMELLASLAGSCPAIAAETDALISHTVEASTAKSLNVMGDWLNQHREHPLYDRAASQFAFRTEADDPESARHWAATIKDDALRVSTQERLGVKP